jgi:hypothetical protein
MDHIIPQRSRYRDEVSEAEDDLAMERGSRVALVILDLAMQFTGCYP